MAAKLDPAVIQRTRDTLGKVIKKPPLTDKLLNRPPFRYLHDIISEVIKSTGFFRGLYTPQELDAKSIQDKDSKIAFLQKALDTLSFTTGDLVRAKPSKIVSGQESERTNEFLQILSIAILKQLSSTEAVQRVLNGEKPSETLSKEKRKRPHGEKGERKERREENGSRRSHSKERSSDDRQHSGEGAARTKPKEAAKVKANDSPSLHNKSQQSLKSSSSEKLKDTEQVPERPKHRPSRRRPPPQESEASPLENHTGGEGDEEGEAEVGSDTRLDRPSSAKGSRRRRTQHQEEGEARAGVPPSATADEQGPPPTTYSDVIPESHDTNTTADQSSSPPPPPKALLAPGNRPSSARPPPPKIVRQSSTIEDSNARIPSGHSVPPPTVILEVPGPREGEGEEEEDSQFLVKDTTPLDQPPTEAFLGGSEAIGDKPEGALTKTIVATKERLEGDIPQSELPSHHPGISEVQRRKEREMVAREIERLQASIQTLCKSANPLGKNMDYVQEDMDSMQKELETWRTENERHAEALRKEERITELELSPLRTQLGELEARIVEQVDLISATKANILRNDDKIQQMLNSVAFSSS